MLLRLAMVFALTDKTFTIEVQHLEAGMAWIRYWADSVKFIFQSAVDEVNTAQVNVTATKLVEYLTVHSKASRTELIKECFNGHTPREKLDRAIDELLTASPPVIEMETVKRKAGEPGASTKYYRLLANSANCANSELSSGLQPDLPAVRTMRNLQTVAPDFAEFADFVTPANQPPNLMDIDSSLSSHISHGTHEDAEVF